MQSQPGILMSIPTRRPMTVTKVTYKASVRTTVCDIMCTINTAQHFEMLSTPVSLRSLVATLPYEKNRPGFKKGKTKFENMRLSEAKRSLIEELKRDKELFFLKLQREKIDKERLRNESVIPIQALYRGYRARPKTGAYPLQKKPVVVLLQHEIQDELCGMAADLSLKPIAGLNLESRSKTSRRKVRIENAASFRITRLFQMNMARELARTIVDQKREEKINQAARIITNAFRYLKTKNFTKSCEAIRRKELATKLQCGVRAFQASSRVRRLRKAKYENDRRDASAIVIQRAGRSYVKRKREKMSVGRAFGVQSHHARTASQTMTNMGVQLAMEKAIEVLLSENALLAGIAWMEEQAVLAAREEEERRALYEFDKIEQVHTREREENSRMQKEDTLEFEKQGALAAMMLMAAEEMRVEAELVAAEKAQEQSEKDGEEQEEDHEKDEEPLVVETDMEAETPRGEDAATVASTASQLSFHDELDFEDAVMEYVSKAIKKISRRIASGKRQHQQGESSRDSSDVDERPTTADAVLAPIFVEAVVRDALSKLYRDFSSSAATRYVDEAVLTALGSTLDRISDGERRVHQQRMSAAAQEMAREVAAEVMIEAVQSLRETARSNPASPFAKKIREEEEQALAEKVADAALQAVVEAELSNLLAMLAKNQMEEEKREQEEERVGGGGGGGESAFAFAVQAAMDIAEVAKQQAIDEALAAEEQGQQEDDESTSTMRSKMLPGMPLSVAEKRQIDAVYADAVRLFDSARYGQSIEMLDRCKPIMSNVPDLEARRRIDFIQLETTINLLYADNLFALAFYEEAKRLYQNVFDYRMDTYGHSHFLVAEAALCLAEWYRSQAQYNDAETFYYQAKAALEADLQSLASVSVAELPHVHNLYAKMLVNYTEMFKNCGQYFKANKFLVLAQKCIQEQKVNGNISFEVEGEFITLMLSMFKLKGSEYSAVSLHEELLSRRRDFFANSNPRHPKIASSVCNLGTLKLHRSEYEEAMKLANESLTMRTSVYPAEHPAVAASMYLKGCIYFEQGQYELARSAVQESLEYRDRRFGHAHPSVAQSVGTLACIYTAMGEGAVGGGTIAADNLQGAAKAQTVAFGTEIHREIADTIFKLGWNAEFRGAFLEAAQHYEKALELRLTLRPLYGSDVHVHVELEYTKIHLARVYSLTSRVEEAKGLFKDAIKVIRSIVGDSNKIVARCFLCLADFCSMRGDYEDAATLYSLGYDVLVKLFADFPHPEIAEVMLSSARNYRLTGKFSEAAELSRTALAIRVESCGGEGGVLAAQALHEQAQVERDQGRFLAAETLYLKALNVYIARREERGAFYACALGDSAECARLLGKHDIAEHSFSRAIGLQKEAYGENSFVLAQTLCNYAVLLMDMKHYLESSKILQGKVVPLLTTLVGKTHPWTLYASANFTFCAQYLQQLSGTATADSVSRDEVSDDGSATYISHAPSVRIPLDKHQEIIDLLDFFHKSTYSDDHPWVSRFLDIFNMTSSAPPSEIDEASLTESDDLGSVESFRRRGSRRSRKRAKGGRGERDGGGGGGEGGSAVESLSGTDADASIAGSVSLGEQDKEDDDQSGSRSRAGERGGGGRRRRQKDIGAGRYDDDGADDDDTNNDEDDDNDSDSASQTRSQQQGRSRALEKAPKRLLERGNSISSALTEYISLEDEASVDSWEPSIDSYDQLTTQSGDRRHRSNVAGTDTVSGSGTRTGAEMDSDSRTQATGVTRETGTEYSPRSRPAPYLESRRSSYRSLSGGEGAEQDSAYASGSYITEYDAQTRDSRASRAGDSLVSGSLLSARSRFSSYKSEARSSSANGGGGDGDEYSEDDYEDDDDEGDDDESEYDGPYSGIYANAGRSGKSGRSGRSGKSSKSAKSLNSRGGGGVRTVRKGEESFDESANPVKQSRNLGSSTYTSSSAAASPPPYDSSATAEPSGSSLSSPDSPKRGGGRGRGGNAGRGQLDSISTGPQKASVDSFTMPPPTQSTARSSVRSFGDSSYSKSKADAGEGDDDMYDFDDGPSVISVISRPAAGRAPVGSNRGKGGVSGGESTYSRQDSYISSDDMSQSQQSLSETQSRAPITRDSSFVSRSDALGRREKTQKTEDGGKGEEGIGCGPAAPSSAASVASVHWSDEPSQVHSIDDRSVMSDSLASAGPLPAAFAAARRSEGVAASADAGPTNTTTTGTATSKSTTQAENRAKQLQQQQPAQDVTSVQSFGNDDDDSYLDDEESRMSPPPARKGPAVPRADDLLNSKAPADRAAALPQSIASQSRSVQSYNDDFDSLESGSLAEQSKEAADAWQGSTPAPPAEQFSSVSGAEDVIEYSSRAKEEVRGQRQGKGQEHGKEGAEGSVEGGVQRFSDPDDDSYTHAGDNDSYDASPYRSRQQRSEKSARSPRTARTALTEKTERTERSADRSPRTGSRTERTDRTGMTERTEHTARRSELSRDNSYRSREEEEEEDSYDDGSLSRDSRTRTDSRFTGSRRDSDSRTGTDNASASVSRALSGSASSSVGRLRALAGASESAAMGMGIDVDMDVGKGREKDAGEEKAGDLRGGGGGGGGGVIRPGGVNLSRGEGKQGGGARGKKGGAHED